MAGTKKRTEDFLKKAGIPNAQSRIQTELESNRDYRGIANRIITVSQNQLADQQRSKVELRRRFAWVFSALLILEYVYLAAIILLDAITPIPLDVPDRVLQALITSVFLQTLSAMGVMIAFAFMSREETRIVGLLHRIIEDYQKFQIDTPPREPEHDGGCDENE